MRVPSYESEGFHQGKGHGGALMIVAIMARERNVFGDNG